MRAAHARPRDLCSCRQFHALNRKNCILKLRNVPALLLEVLLPPLFIVLLWAIRTTTKVTNNNGTRYTVNTSDTELNPFAPPTLTQLVDTSFPVNGSVANASQLLGLLSPVFLTNFLTVGSGYSTFVQCNSDWIGPVINTILTNASVLTGLVAAIGTDIEGGNLTVIVEAINALRADEHVRAYIEYRDELALLMNDPPNSTECFFLRLALVQANGAHPSASAGIARLEEALRRASPLLSQKVQINTSMTQDELEAALAAQTNITANNIGVAIVVSEASAELWNYTIRLPWQVGTGVETTTFIPTTMSFKTTDDFLNGLGSDLATYNYDGFLTLQLFVDSVALAIDPDAMDHHMCVCLRVCGNGGGGGQPWW